MMVMVLMIVVVITLVMTTSQSKIEETRKHLCALTGTD